MAVIIGRKQEQKELNRLYHSDEAEMVVVYGRRRVGKTYLVNQVFAQTGFAFKVTGLYKPNTATSSRLSMGFSSPATAISASLSLRV